MKKIFLFSLFFLLVSRVSIATATTFSGSGSGTPSDPYIITTCAQLQEMSADLTASYSLGNDIDCIASSGWNGGAGFLSVGDTTTSFTGTFNGQNHTIDHLYMDRTISSGSLAGLFGQADGSRISNVSFTNASITGIGPTAVVVAESFNTNLSNISVSGSTVTCGNSGACSGITADYYSVNAAFDTGFTNTIDAVSITSSTISGVGDFNYVSGIVGYLGVYNGTSTNGAVTVSNSYVSDTVTISSAGTSARVGGMIGFADSSPSGGHRCDLVITSSYSKATIDGGVTTAGVGGLVGIADSEPSSGSTASLTITKTFTTGSVTGTGEYVGGLIGRVEDDNNASGATIIINNNYSTATVSGGVSTGGLIGGVTTTSSGSTLTATLSNLYSSGTVAGTDNVGGLVGSVSVHHGSTLALTISNSFTISPVTGSTNVGGFIGVYHVPSTTLTNNFYDQTVTTQTFCSSQDNPNPTGCTAVNTDGTHANYFKGNSSVAPLSSWDFSSAPIWDAPDGRLPIIHAISIGAQLVSPYLHGDGTSGNPFQIFNCTDLQAMNTSESSSYILENNIDCSETSTWNPNTSEWVDGIVGGTLIPDGYGTVTHTSVVIANNGYYGFAPVSLNGGNFDGNSKTISNLWIFRKSAAFNGIFSSVQYATIHNLTISDANIVGSTYAGALAGYINNATISHISLSNNMVRTYLEYEGGGLAGVVADNTVVSNVINTGGSVHGSGDIIGGLVGTLNNATLSDSSSSADVDGGLKIGGIAGEIIGNSIVTNTHASGGTVTNNRSEYIVMKTGVDTGGFAGYINTATISDCYSTDIVNATGDYAGGFVGETNAATINNSYATGAVHGLSEVIGVTTYNPNYVGGFAGWVNNSTLNKNFATGNVTTTGSYVGGFAGQVSNSGIIHDAYSTGSVSGDHHVGGFSGDIGFLYDIKRVYSNGAVTSNDSFSTGGLIGATDPTGTFENSFWDNETSGQSTSAKGIGKTTSEMKTPATFSGATWDVTTVWGIDPAFNGGYPAFRYYHTPVEVVTTTISHGGGGGGGHPIVTNIINTNSLPNGAQVAVHIFVFTHTLKKGVIDTDVKELQKYLNTHGFIIAKTGAGSPGNETTKFGLATQNALIAFQKAKGIKPASGFFGLVTMAYINAHQ